MRSTITVDYFRHTPPEGHFHVYDQKTFLQASSRLDAALGNNQEFNIFLTNRALLRWFDQYSGRVSIVVFDPCQELLNALGADQLSLPKELEEDPRFIVSSALIEKATQSQRADHENPLSWVLRQLVDDIWAADVIDDYSSFARVLCSLLASSRRRISPTVQALMNSQVKQWISRSSLKLVLKWLFEEDTLRRAQALVAARLLWSYPHDVKCRLLRFNDHWVQLTTFANYQEAVEQLPLDPLFIFQLSPEARSALHDFLLSELRRGGIPSVVGMLGGLVEEEAAVTKYLEENFDKIDISWNDSLEQITNIFSRNEKCRATTEYLRKLTPFKYPTDLSVSASWQEASLWLETEYFPYYRWCSTLNNVAATEDLVQKFEAWLLENYYNLTRTDAYTPYRIHSTLERVLQKSSVLLVIMDALPWHLSTKLVDELKKFTSHQIECNISITTIPTITRIAKPSLVRGQLPGQISPQPDAAWDYKNLLAGSVGINANDIAYCISTDGDPSSIFNDHKKVYLYLDNEIDSIVHKPFAHDARLNCIQRHLEYAGSYIGNFATRYRDRYGSELTILITSDHGFTEQPAGATSFTLDEDFGVDHNKIICSYNDNLADDRFVFIDRVMSGGGQGYYVAKGYRSINSKPKGAMHGGLTPQEVAVPSIMINPYETFVPQPISVTIAGEIRRAKSDNNVTLIIYNPNSAPAHLGDFHLRLVEIINLPQIVSACSSVHVTANVDAQGVRDAFISLNGYVDIKVNGIELHCMINTDVETFGAVVIDREFEDEFDI